MALFWQFCGRSALLGQLSALIPGQSLCTLVRIPSASATAAASRSASNYLGLLLSTNIFGTGYSDSVAPCLAKYLQLPALLSGRVPPLEVSRTCW